MSWLLNPFKPLQETQQQNHGVLQNGGVNDDLTAFGDTIGCQVQTFFSPETSTYGGGDGGGGGGGSPSSRTMEGIRSDLEEIKGSFNRAVSEISKLASNFLKLNDDDGDDDDDGDYVNRKVNYGNCYDGYDDDVDDDGDDVGVDDDVVEFAQQISDRPELWTEFPLSFDHEFELSEAQYQHVSIIEQLVSSLADLRSRISSNKSEKQFWIIYFILLLTRLNEDDAKLLSTPETVEARETLLKMLQSKKNVQTDSENSHSDSTSDTDNEVQRAPVISTQTVETVKTADNTLASRIDIDEANVFDAKPGNSNVGIVIEESAGTSKQFQSEDDVSFSDLEDDNSKLHNRHLSSRSSHSTRSSSSEGSNDWVRLNNDVEYRANQLKGQSSSRERYSEGEDSAGWLTVDDFNP